MIKLTEKAAEVINNIIEEDNKKYIYLRLVVLSSGCSCGGGKYNLYLDNKKEENDLVFESHGVKILIDPVSYEEAKGTTIDYIKDEIFGEVFKINNPNETSASCNCKNKNENNCECGNN